MIEESDAVLPIWMVLSAAFGFIVGDAFGDSRRHRKCLQETNEDLHDELEKARAFEEPLLQELKQQRSILRQEAFAFVACLDRVSLLPNLVRAQRRSLIVAHLLVHA